MSKSPITIPNCDKDWQHCYWLKPCEIETINTLFIPFKEAE